MKVAYDPRTDTLTVVLREGIHVAESDEERSGVILEYDAAGNLVSLEIVEASKRVTDPHHADFRLL